MTEQNNMTTTSMVKGKKLQKILEAALLAAGQPLSQPQLAELFTDEDRPPNGEISRALEQLKNDCADRGIELIKVASGYRIQVRQEYNQWVSRLWKERPQRYSRALLETMALIAYRQPITRGEIEDIRGVAVAKGTVDTLLEAGWIKPRGRKQTPGRPLMWGTTDAFLDHFGLSTVKELPGMEELKAAGLLDRREGLANLPTSEDDEADEDVDPELEMEDGEEAQDAGTSAEVIQLDQAR